MEEIVGLLIIIAAYIFKAVGKKLEKSGTPDQPGTEKDFKSILEEVFQVDTMLEEQPADRPSAPAAAEEGERAVVTPQPMRPEPVTPEPVAPQPVRPAPVRPTPVKPSVVKPSVSRPAAVKPSVPRPLKEEEDKPKEKIDPKKLIIYSEIMTPKCMSNN